MKLRYFLFFVFFASYSFSSLALAENVESKTKELTALQKMIKKINQKIKGLKTKKNSLLVELKKLDVQFGKISTELKNLEDNNNQLKEKLEHSRQLIKNKQQEIDSQKQALESLVKIAYGMGRHEKIKLMLSQEDTSVSGRMMVYHDYLNKARLKKITIIKQGLQQLRDLELENIRETEVLQAKLEQVKKKKSALLKTKAERKTLVAKIKKRFSRKKQKLSQYKASEKKLKGIISSLQSSTNNFSYEKGSSKRFSLLKGKLPWPLQGKVKNKFGAQRSDTRWDGVVISAKEGAEVRVVAKGRVVFADWLRGYGLLTIIDHGDGYMTLYAFSQSLYKKVGERVKAGDVIAVAGQSGGRSEIGLYFGIRKKGKPVDPVKWCQRNRHK
jgi:septal ring factor EnvC (AmiA/AmiB activator)